jgi:hypothetical protein
LLAAVRLLGLLTFLREEVPPLHLETGLSPQEAQRLHELENIIQESLDSFLRVGLCFAEVRFKKLHRATHDTFESYCHDRWGLSLSRTNQIISSVKVVENITGAFPEDASLLEETNECALRPLARLAPELQVAAWELIKQIESRPSGTTIQEVVSTIRNAIESGWQERGRQVAENEDTQEASSAQTRGHGKNGTTPHRAHGRASNQLAALSRWVNRVNTWDPDAIALADDELRLKAHLKAARALRTFCEAFIQALESRLATT